jgi:glutathione S-transferase
VQILCLLVPPNEFKILPTQVSSRTLKMPATLYYWGIKARSYASLVVAKAGGIEVVNEQNMDLGAMKPTLPFGQLPYLEDGDVKIAQSNAILRYVARKGGLLGSTDAEAAHSEMLIEEANDIFNICAKANGSGDKAVAYKEIFASSIPAQLAYVEKFTLNSETPLAGDYTIACVLDMLNILEPGCLDAFPNVSAFFNVMIAKDAFSPYKDMNMYLSRS